MGEIEKIDAYGLVLLGIDVGEARIGVAVCEKETRIAVPLETFHVRKSQVAEDIASLCVKRNVSAIVIGWPLTFDNKEGRAVKRVERFLEQLEAHLPEELKEHIFKFDERLTTSAAHRAFDEANVDHRRRRDKIDQLAATYILQGFVDAQGW